VLGATKAFVNHEDVLMSEVIRVAVAGVGNCASSLLQGIVYYRRRLENERVRETVGLMHYDLGGYLPGDIRCVCAFDIDRRKVGKPLEKAFLAPPNCTKVFQRNIGNKSQRFSITIYILVSSHPDITNTRIKFHFYYIVVLEMQEMVLIKIFSQQTEFINPY